MREKAKPEPFFAKINYDGKRVYGIDLAPAMDTKQAVLYKGLKLVKNKEQNCKVESKWINMLVVTKPQSDGVFQLTSVQFNSHSIPIEEVKSKEFVNFQKEFNQCWESANLSFSKPPKANKRELSSEPNFEDIKKSADIILKKNGF